MSGKLATWIREMDSRAFKKEKNMTAISAKTIEEAITMLRRIKDDSSEPKREFDVSEATAIEIKGVADGFIAVVTALVAVTMENVLETVAEEDAADVLYERLWTFLCRMTAMDEAQRLLQ
jgi:hypothetical protein